MTDSAAAAPKKRENLLLNVGLNVIMPSLILMKGESWLGMTDQRLVLVVALAFPLCYGLYDFVLRSKTNFFSILGIVSTLISGGVGLLGLDKDLIAIKEAAIPGLFAIAVIVSLWTPFPLIRTFLFTPEIFDVKKIDIALHERNTVRPFERLMVVCTLYLAGSFVLSSILNYALAKYFIRSETGTDEFNAELGRMTLWSYPIIVIPSTVVMLIALWQLIKGIQKYTGYEMDDILVVGAAEDREQVGADVTDSEASNASGAGSATEGDRASDEAAGENELGTNQ